MMNHYSHQINALQSSLSPSAQTFITASKSEPEDSIWRDLNFDDLSNFSSDLETPKEGQVLNPNSRFSNLPKLMITSSKVVGDEKLDLSSKKPDQDDSEIDSPCWRGIQSHKSLDSGAKSVTDDLSGFNRLNPLAPQFIPSNSKTEVKNHEEKSMSLTLPSLSEEFGVTDCPEDGMNDAARRKTILNHNADENSDFISQNRISKTASLSDTRKLDPLAPVFVPSSAKLSLSVDEKQTNAHSTSVPTNSDDKLRNTVKVVTCSGEDASHSLMAPHGVYELGSTSSYSPWNESKVGITKYASSSYKSYGQKKLNPLAPQFSLSDTKLKAYGYAKNQAADDLSLMVNTTSLSSPTWDHNLVDAGLADTSVYVEPILPNISRGSSLLSAKPVSNFGSTQWLAGEASTTLSVKSNRDLKHPLPFHVVDTAASSSLSNVKALSNPSPKMDVKKLLTTIHGLSELLTLAHGSESSNSLIAEEVDLINSTVHNLNLYIKSNIQKQGANQSLAQRNSYDLAVLPNKSKLSIRDIQLPNHTAVDFDIKRKEKYSMVSEETVPDSRLCEYDPTKENGFYQVVANGGYQQNHLGEEQINTNAALLYKSLWLKAEAERSLLLYESSLSNPGF